MKTFFTIAFVAVLTTPETTAHGVCSQNQTSSAAAFLATPFPKNCTLVVPEITMPTQFNASSLTKDQLLHACDAKACMDYLHAALKAIPDCEVDVDGQTGVALFDMLDDTHSACHTAMVDAATNDSSNVGSSKQSGIVTAAPAATTKASAALSSSIVQSSILFVVGAIAAVAII